MPASAEETLPVRNASWTPPTAIMTPNAIEILDPHFRERDGVSSERISVISN
jgi:hypothetical protein